MLAEALPVITALHAVQHPIRAEIGRIDQFAILIEIEAPGIAATFAEQLEAACDRMIAPHALLKLDSTNVRRDRTALAAVKPAVRSPGQ